MKKKNIILSALAVGSLFTAGCILSSCDNSDNKPPFESGSQVVDKEDITGIAFNGATYKYSGEIYNLKIEGNLPSGVNVEYKNNSQVEPGEYQVIAHFVDTTGKYNVPDDMTATLVIEKIEITGIAFKNKTVEYSGEVINIEIEGDLPEGVTVIYTDNGNTNPGAYEVTAHFIDNTGHYIVPEDMTAMLTIEKQTIDNISFNDKKVKYNGAITRLAIEGQLPEGVYVDYTNNDNVNAGTYEVVAHFVDSTGKYNVPEDMKATLVIEKIDYDISELAIDDMFFTYTGQEITFISDFIYNGVNIHFKNSKQTDVGNYEVTWNIDDPLGNYNAIEDQKFNAIISYLTMDFDNRSLTATILDCHVDAVDIVIPDTISRNGNVYKVTDFYTFDPFSNCPKLESLKINKYISNEVTPYFKNSPNLTKIEVDPENKFFAGDETNSSLYDKNHTILYCGTGSTVINEGLTTIGEYAFTKRNIENIVAPNSLKKICLGAFENCKNLKSFKFNDGIEYIGQFAFGDCVNLQELVVTSIDVKFDIWCFTGCTGLTYINIPFTTDSKESDKPFVSSPGMDNIFGEIPLTNVKEIVISAPTRLKYGDFSLFPNVEKVTIGNSLEHIDNSPFKENNCISELIIPFTGQTLDSESGSINFLFNNGAPESLKKVTLTKAKKIHSHAFSECDYIEYVNLPNLEVLGESSFFRLNNLREVTFSDKFTSIGSWCFYECPKLSKINNIDNVSTIETLCFNGLPALESFRFPDKVEQVSMVLYDCANLKRVEFGANFKSFEYVAPSIQKCPNLREIVVDKNNPYLDSRNDCNAVIDTATNNLILGCPTTVIPNTVTSIGLQAFNNGYHIKKIYIPASVVSIDNFSFGNLSDCEEIIVDPLNLKYSSGNGKNCIVDLVDKKFLYGCANTVMPNDIASISDYAFYGNTKITSIAIPDSVSKIGRSAFEDCTSLNKVTLSNNLYYLPNCFSGCTSLEEIFIPYDCVVDTTVFNRTSIKKIKLASNHKHYYGNEYNAIIRKSDNVLIKGVEGTIIPATVSEISDTAFYGSTIKNIVIPNTITTIGSNVFDSCYQLESLEIQSEVTALSGIVSGCENLKTIKLPGTLTKLSNYSFNNCKSLVDVYFDGTIEMWKAISFESEYDNPLKFTKNFHYRDADGNWVTTKVN